MDPTFPLTVVWDDGSRELLEDRTEVETGLEWFDTDDTDGGAVTVVDAQGRPVRLKVEALTIVTCELAEAPAVPAEEGAPAAHQLAA